jgi:hypothetical protein
LSTLIKNLTMKRFLNPFKPQSSLWPQSYRNDQFESNQTSLNCGNCQVPPPPPSHRLKCQREQLCTFTNLHMKIKKFHFLATAVTCDCHRRVLSCAGPACCLLNSPHATQPATAAALYFQQPVLSDISTLSAHLHRTTHHRVLIIFSYQKLNY